MKSRKTVLRSFEFLGSESIANAELALRPNRPSAFLITGEACTGKTRLARLILNNLGIESIWCCSARVGSDIERALPIAADLGYFLLDDMGEAAMKSHTLRIALVMREFSFRAPGTCHMRTVANNCLTIITSSRRWHEVPETLRRQCYRIDLIAKKGRAK